MKKIFVVFLLVVSFASNSALAKTDGSYVGLDLLNTKIKFYERYTNDATPTLTDRQPSFSHNDYGAGLHYNYAINMRGVFVAPGVFFEFNNATANGYGEQKLQRLKIKNRYGVKLDVGGDITDVIAPYLTGGYAAISHNSREYFNDYTNSRVRNHSSMVWFYGAGVKFNCDKKTAVTIEYNTQNFAVRNSTDGSTNNLVSRYQSRMDVLKLGISYRF